MRVVIPGGSGHVGTLLASSFHAEGHDVVVLSRRGDARFPWRVIRWDGQTLGDWARAVDGAEVVINLAGRSVDCRYTARNRKEIFESRVRSTRLIGEAIAASLHPPRTWLQMSTATIYAHRFDAPNGEDGILGGSEPDSPSSWRFSIAVAKAWEQALNEADTPRTRRVIMRAAVVMSPERGGLFDTLLALVRFHLGGRLGSGKQWMSWIHGHDFVRSVQWLIARRDIEGVVNLAAPNPLPLEEFFHVLQSEWGTRFGLPAPAWLLEIGAVFLQTETELILKSRRVVPARLLEHGFAFRYAKWPDAARDLCQQWRLIHRAQMPPRPERSQAVY